MAQARVLIVARTRMHGEKVCVGALSDRGEHLRLMNTNCDSDIASKSPYRIGEWWDVQGESCGEQKPPHVEDFAVTQATRTGKQSDLQEHLLNIIDPWEGPIDVLFDGKIRFTRAGGGYISPGDVPKGATGFWIPESKLTLDEDGRGNSGYYGDDGFKHLSYVGSQEAIEEIGAGQLVRVSLARWWKPRDADPSFELRCYAQLSGWY
jgi:hypothetical protein